jgi:predicted acetyltransferase
VAEDELPMRISTAGDIDDVRQMLYELFHGTVDRESEELTRAVLEPDRGLVVTDGGQIVAHTAAYTRDLTVPGAIVPAAHVTAVGVASTHRRRRLLTRLMHRQLRDLRDARREPIAALWSTESTIYPRFGYGLGAQRLIMEIDIRDAGVGGRPSAADGRLRAAAAATLRDEMTKLYDELRPERPGWSSRDERWWNRLLADGPAARAGGTPLRAVVHETDAGVDGYAIWRSKGERVAEQPRCEVSVTELAAANPSAYAALWEFLLGLDLARVARYRHGAVDEPLLHLAKEPRALGAHLVDALWVRVVDVGAALSARRYACPVDVVLDVTDPILAENTGRWRLVGDASTASCTRTDASADLSCTVTDLGSVYLGGPTWTGLAGAGRVREHRPGVLAAATTAFGWHRAPQGVEVF